MPTTSPIKVPPSRKMKPAICSPLRIKEYAHSQSAVSRIGKRDEVTYAKTAKEVCNMIKAQTPAGSEKESAGGKTFGGWRQVVSPYLD